MYLLCVAPGPQSKYQFHVALVCSKPPASPSVRVGASVARLAECCTLLQRGIWRLCFFPCRTPVMMLVLVPVVMLVS